MLARVALLLVAATALLLLGAHFFRAGLLPLAALCAALVALLFVRTPGAARALQVALLLGSIEWLRTGWALATARAVLGQPYLRMAAILAAVAALTAFAAWAVRSRRLHGHFRIE